MAMEIAGRAPLNIENKQVAKKENIPAAYRNIAAGMERQFLEYMLEKMKATISEEEPSTAQNYYNGLQTSEQAKALTEKDEGMGIQEMILNQIYPKNRRNTINAAQNQYLNNKGSKL